MATFKVVFEIEVESRSPLTAAYQVQEWLRRNDWQFYVQNAETLEIFSVDLLEEDEDAVLPVKEYTPIIENT
jgi:hypothetical protein